MQKIIIFGAGGLAREICYLINRCLSDKFSVIGYVVEEQFYDKTKRYVDGLPVYCKEFLHENEIGVVMGFSLVKEKKRLCEELLSYSNLSFPSIIEPSNNISPDSSIGQGVVMTGYCSVSVNVKIGDFVLMNGGVWLGHDAQIGSYSSLMPRCSISGNVTVEEGVIIGAHSFVLEKKKIGENSVVAPGSIVFTNVIKDVTVVGNPARILMRHNDK